MPVSRACVKTQLLEPEFYAVGANMSQTTVLNYIEPKISLPGQKREATKAHQGARLKYSEGCYRIATYPQGTCWRQRLSPATLSPRLVLFQEAVTVMF